MGALRSILALISTARCALESAALSLGQSHNGRRTPPHLIHIVADDVGWNDLGVSNHEIKTPNIDRLMRGGVQLERFYAQKECAPSRSSMMTGRLPFRYGYYSNPSDDGAIPTNYTLLPEILRGKGYRTHAVGKWHCGFNTKEVTPTYRGFESFLGFWHWGEEYFGHVFPPYYKVAKCRGIDLMNASGPEISPALVHHGTFSTDLYLAEFERIVATHPASEPLYVYFALQNAHDPYEHVPPELLHGYSPSMHPLRRNFSALVSNLDWAVGKVQAAMEQAGLWEDTVLFFNSDNGGELLFQDQSKCSDDCLTTGCCGGAGSNWPLRGGKFTLWEGGVRSRSFVYAASPSLIPKARRGTTWSGLAHVSDVLPTLAGLAGAKVAPANRTKVSFSTVNGAGQAVDGVVTDGFDLWGAITEGLPSPRTELLHQPLNMYWDKECQEADTSNPFVPSCGASITVWPLKLYIGFPGDDRVVDAKQGMSFSHSAIQTSRHLCSDTPCLFNIDEDPSESTDLAAHQPEDVARLSERLQALSVPEAAPQPPDAMTPDPSDQACSMLAKRGAWYPWAQAV